MSSDAGFEAMSGEGLVIKHYSGFYYVASGDQVWECKPRGKLKQQSLLTGDRVLFTDLGNGQGVVEQVLPRKSELVRPSIANVDTVIIVTSHNDPPPSLWLIDRLLVLSEHSGLDPVIVVNKSDLASVPEADMIEDVYPRIGYRVINTSARKGKGIHELISVMRDRVSVLAGQSGVGKSSLMNAICPGLTLKTAEVSKKTARGRHTTRHTELYPVPGGGWVADTPGFSVLDLPQSVGSRQLVPLFPEIASRSLSCRFPDCYHDREPDCAVKEALASREISSFRYEHYLELLHEVKKRERSY